MRSKIESVTPQGYAQGTKTLYKVQASNGKLYTCFSKRIADMVGKEVEFTEENKPYNGQDQWVMNLPKEEGFQGGGFNKSYKTYGKSKDEMVLTAKTMVLAYCKDIAVAIINKQQGAEVRSWDVVKTGFKELMPLLDLDKLPEAPKQPVAAQSTTVPAPSAPTLRPALIAILQGAMKKKNFRARDMVDYAAAACGVELKWDVAADEVVWCCSEQDAQKIINALA